MNNEFHAFIFLDPGQDLFPLVNKYIDKHMLPIVNKPLLFHNIKFLAECCNKITIVGLKKLKDSVEKVIDEFIESRSEESFDRKNIEFLEIMYFEGVHTILLSKIDQVTSKRIIIMKGDIITNVKLSDIIVDFKRSKTKFYTILTKKKSENYICYKNNEILYYKNNNPIKNEIFSKFDKVKISTELDTIQLYICDKECILYTEKSFSFKNTFFPTMVEKLLENIPVKFFYKENSFFQIKTPDDYLEANMFVLSNLKSFSYKGNPCISTKSTSVLENIEIGKSKIFKSIIGEGTKIGDKVKISSSVIMNAVIIGNNVKIENCVIGCNVIIPENSTLKNCKISSNFIFKETVKLLDQNIMALDN
ncbi:Translation initiation factor eIF-2B [Spraguea lophii 42_110]|uniref:Translation initiation factor eIF2B subunit gamma n=1 Tax=Spraguea lophii (strain 42_110) TaxID=1358809 RepID=S7XPX4_SPRLO|nr:Translation initiation factor eIF-2B [Spraguea lophii 42_110]